MWHPSTVYTRCTRSQESGFERGVPQEQERGQQQQHWQADVHRHSERRHQLRARTTAGGRGREVAARLQRCTSRCHGSVCTPKSAWPSVDHISHMLCPEFSVGVCMHQACSGTFQVSCSQNQRHIRDVTNGSVVSADCDSRKTCCSKTSVGAGADLCQSETAAGGSKQQQ